jgi:hypothetical protein
MTTALTKRTRVSKPDWWVKFEERFGKLEPTALPPPPWILSHTEPGRAMAPTGGTFSRVVDNEAYLRHLRRDLAKGPNGPRGKVVMGDLEDLRIALEKYNAEGA